MRNRFLLGMMALSLIGMTSCKDEIDQFDDHGSSTIVSFVGSEKLTWAIASPSTSK